MRHAISTPGAVRRAAVLSFGLLALVCAKESVAATGEAADSGTYEWSAELVAFDPASNTATVKARIVEHTDGVDLESLRAGDRATLTWSGISFAAGVRGLERGTGSSDERMSMPVEFVASELDGRYVVFKVPVPADSAGRIANLEPGTWVTATSPHRPANQTEAVVSIRPYNDAS